MRKNYLTRADLSPPFSFGGYVRDYTTQLWDTFTGKCYYSFRGHEAEVICVVFNFQSTLVGTGSMDQTGRLWDVETGRAVACLRVCGESSKLLRLLSGLCLLLFLIYAVCEETQNNDTATTTGKKRKTNCLLYQAADFSSGYRGIPVKSSVWGLPRLETRFLRPLSTTRSECGTRGLLCGCFRSWDIVAQSRRLTSILKAHCSPVAQQIGPATCGPSVLVPASPLSGWKTHHGPEVGRCFNWSSNLCFLARSLGRSGWADGIKAKCWTSTSTG